MRATAVEHGMSPLRASTDIILGTGVRRWCAFVSDWSKGVRRFCLLRFMKYAIYMFKL